MLKTDSVKVARLPADFMVLMLVREVYDDEEEEIYEEYYWEEVGVTVDGKVVRIPRSRIPRGTYYTTLGGVRGILDVDDESDGYWFRLFRVEDVDKLIAVAKFYYPDVVILYTASLTANLVFAKTRRTRRVYYVDGGLRLYLGSLRSRCYEYGIVQYREGEKTFSFFSDRIC